MRSLAYLWLRTIKNKILELRKSPARLVLYIIIIIGLFSTIILMHMSPSSANIENNSLLDIRFLEIALFLYMLIFVYGSVSKGLSTGASFFDMSDVNFLFVSPINPNSVLIYGMIRKIGTAFLMAFFLLFQGANLKNLFNLDFIWILLLMSSIILGYILSEILALFIYTFSVNSTLRKTIVKIVVLAIFSPLIIYFINYYFIVQRDFVQLALEVTDSPIFYLIPISGWVSRGAMLIINGNLVHGLLFFALIIVTGIILLFLSTMGKTDYYEDVLTATEAGREQKDLTMQTGDKSSYAKLQRKVRVNKMGIWGNGASSILGKQLREFSRGSILGFISKGTLIYIIIIVALKNTIPIEAYSFGVDIIFLGIFAMLIYIETILVGTGRGNEELYSHYIYMIPSNPFAKIFWNGLDYVLQSGIQAVIMFSVVGYVYNTDLLLTIACMIFYVVHIFYLTSVNYLSIRIFKSSVAKGITRMFFMFVAIMLMLPGIVVAILFFVFSNEMNNTSIIGALAILGLWEIFVGAICILLSQGLLTNSDMPVKIGKQ